MPLQRQVYLLKPQELSPETIAVTFAKTSRSPESFREIAAGLTDQKSAQFHEKWVVGYGHASVAEHAVLHIAIENISRLAIENVESNRLASYTEKSTRYQTWNKDNFFIPSELKSDPLENLYQVTCQNLFAAYERFLPIIKELVSQETPLLEGESNTSYERRLRSEYVDVCRYLLPAASLANVGVTINARALEHMLCKLLSDPLDEVRSLGEEIKKISQEDVPTLIKYANPSAYLMGAHKRLVDEQMPSVAEPLKGDWCDLVSFDSKNEERIIAAAMYKVGSGSYENAVLRARNMTPNERARIAQKILGGMDPHDIPLRELEYSNYTFDLILDQGAYFELKRHRMLTLTPQALTPNLGYVIPRRIFSAGLEKEYCQAMEDARDAYMTIAKYNPNVASYLVPNGFNRRVLLSMNLRSAFHLIALRTAPNAHFAIRRIAQRIANEIQRCTPLMANFLPRYSKETWQDIENLHFYQV